MIGKSALILEKDKKTGKTSYKEDNKVISLAVELIHSLKSMDGKKRISSWIESNTYKDPNGIEQIEIQKREELETHGLGGFYNQDPHGNNYVNEQDIRSDLGMNPREAYTPEWNTDSNGDVYKPKHKTKND